MKNSYDEKQVKVAFGLHVVESINGRLITDAQLKITEGRIKIFQDNAQEENEEAGNPPLTLYNPKTIQNYRRDYKTLSGDHILNAQEETLINLENLYALHPIAYREFVKNFHLNKYRRYTEMSKDYLAANKIFEPADKINTLLAKWKGMSYEEEGTFDLSIEISDILGQRKAAGQIEIVYTHPSNPFNSRQSLYATVTTKDDFKSLTVDYINENSTITQHGAIFLVHDEVNNTLQGDFAGYGLGDKLFTRGSVFLRKVI